MKKLFSFKQKFDPKLAAFLDLKISQTRKIDPKILPITQKIKDFVLRGGKRFRPAFLFYGFKACGGENEEKVFPSCLAVELFHAFALIHDDIIDNSNLRRGGPALHKVLGVSGAILAGDLLFSWAEEVFGEKARKYWDFLKEEVILGQYLEIKLFSLENSQNLKRSREILRDLEQDLLKILEYKTARYSVVRPLQIGASLAGAKEKELKVLENYGLPLGIAFQITDDILGMFGEEETIGKPVDSDLREGKATLLIVKTISKLKAQSAKCKTKKTPREWPSAHSRGERTLKKFLNLLGNRGATKKDLEWVRNLIRKTGALADCQNKAKALAEEAKRAIKDYSFEGKAKEFLLETADFIIKRKY